MYALRRRPWLLAAPATFVVGGLVLAQLGSPVQAADRSAGSARADGNSRGNSGTGVGNGGGDGNNGMGVPVTVTAPSLTGLSPGARMLTHVTVQPASGQGGLVQEVTGVVTNASVPRSVLCAWQDVVVEGYKIPADGPSYRASSTAPARVPVYVSMRDSGVNQDLCRSITVTITFRANVQG